MQALPTIVKRKTRGLSENQEKFVNDILSCYQMLQQIDAWKNQFDPAPAANPAETAPGTLPTPDSGK
jgi:hypothetical protein